MMPGLEGRRIAVYAQREAGGEADHLCSALEAAGARLEFLSSETSGGRGEAAWHGGRYAAAVVGSANRDLEPRVVQLLREFLLTGKPVIVIGDGLRLLEQAGGTRADALTTGSKVGNADAAVGVVRALGNRLNELEVDEMSDLSFPASDPPAVTPSTIGPDHGRDPDTRV